MKLFLLATLAAALPHTMAQCGDRVPGVGCCAGPYDDTTSPTLAEYHATLCYNYQCPEGYVGRDPCDCHTPGDAPSDGECCLQQCSAANPGPTADVTCAAGETLKANERCYHGTDCAETCCAVMCDSCVRPPTRAPSCLPTLVTSRTS
jgi:hypothetical protein